MRGQLGEQHHRSKITEDDARLIKELLHEREQARKKANELTWQAIADKFEVSVSLIRHIDAGRTWRHI